MSIAPSGMKPRLAALAIASAASFESAAVVRSDLERPYLDAAAKLYAKNRRLCAALPAGSSAPS